MDKFDIRAGNGMNIVCFGRKEHVICLLKRAQFVGVDTDYE